MLKKIFSHTMIYGLAPQITMVVNFFLLPFITKELSDIDYGVYGTVITYSTAFAALGDLGMKVNITNAFYKHPMQYKWAWRQYYGFLNIWNLFFACFQATIIYFIVPEEAIGHRWTIVMLSTLPFVLMGQTALLGRKYYQLKQIPAQIAIRSLVFGLLTAILNYLFIAVYKMGYMGWFWSIFISTILSNFSYWYALNVKLKLSPIFNFKKRLIYKSLKVSIPTIPHFYSGYLLNSSQILIMDRTNVPTGDIGRYQAANTFGIIADGVSTAVGWAIGPILNQKYKEQKDNEARYLIFLLQVVFFLGTFLACIWLKEIFWLMIKNDVLNQMYYLGIILIMAVNYRPMYFGSVSKVIYREKTSMLWRLSFTSGMINVIGSLIFIPIYGFEAAVYVGFVSFMYMGYAGYFFKAFKDVEQENYHPLFWLLASVILTGLAYWIVEWQWISKIFVSVLACAFAGIWVYRLNLKISL